MIREDKRKTPIKCIYLLFVVTSSFLYENDYLLYSFSEEYLLNSNYIDLLDNMVWSVIEYWNRIGSYDELTSKMNGDKDDQTSNDLSTDEQQVNGFEHSRWFYYCICHQWMVEVCNNFI